MDIIAMCEQLFSAIAKGCSCAETKTEYKAENEVLKDKKKFQKENKILKIELDTTKKVYSFLIARSLDLLKQFKTQMDKEQLKEYRKLLIDIRKVAK